MRTITISTIFATSSTSQGKSIVIGDGRYSLRDLCAHFARGFWQLAEMAARLSLSLGECAMCGAQRLNRRWHSGHLVPVVTVPSPNTVRVG